MAKSISIVEADILTCSEDVLVHQVNCQGVMGSGIAKQIKATYPDVFKAYYYQCKTTNPNELLGTSLICGINPEDTKFIANVYGQFNFGRGLQTNYNALKNGLKEVKDFAVERNLSVAIPYKIGCGLGGGSWKTVKAMITEIFSDLIAVNKVKLYKYKG